MSREFDYGGLAATVLELYDLEVAECRLIRHNENMAFKVRSGSGDYLLRIHKPISANFGGERFRAEYLESELAWLSALGRDPEFVVQKPMRNRDGDRVTHVEHRDENLPCTLLSWIEGADFDQKAPDADEKVRQAGALTAKLHGFVEKWEPPPDFARPSYDAAHFRDAVRKLSAAVELGFVQVEEFALLERACEAVIDLVADAKTMPHSWGLIHADLGPQNIIVHAGGLSPIDFSLSGFGPFMWDIGGMLPAYKRELRRAWVAGYESLRPSPPSWERLADGMAVMSIASCQAFHISNPAQHEWLSKRMPKSVEGEWRRFLNGEGVVFDV